MSAAWNILPRTSLPSSVPPLLVKYKSDGAGYTVYLTDLTYIWAEFLNNEQVIQRSLDEETSIEPKDDSDQLRILLAKIGDGLSGSDETDLNLLPGNDGKHLRLDIFARLPSPFRPLQWPVHLRPLTSEALRAEMLIPLLANQKALRKQVASLLVHIKEKDNVILKLTDKLESSNIDMTMMFPGAIGVKVGRRGLGRATATKVVPGLAAFNEDSWRIDTSEADSPSDHENELILSLFPNELPDSKRMTDEHPLNAWWDTLPGEAKRVSKAAELLVRNDKERGQTGFQGYERLEMEEEATEHDIDDEFERQATPPSVKRAASLLQTPEAPGRSSRGKSKQRSFTESSQAPSTKAHPTTVSRSKPRKLGLVGGSSRMNVLDAQQGDPSETSKTGVQRSSSSVNDRVVEIDDQDEQAPKRSLPSTPSLVQVKHRLGVIGGKRKNTEGDVSDPHNNPAMSPASPYRPTKEWGNTEKLDIGAIPADPLDEEVRERQERTSYASRTPSLPRSPSGILSTPQTHITPLVESSQEKADRKRAELRKLLEEKAKAPTQKRRKF